MYIGSRYYNIEKDFLGYNYVSKKKKKIKE